MESYEVFEEAAEAIREKNLVVLNEFGNALHEAGLKDKTINRHVGNVGFYINDYLLYDELREIEDGIEAIDGFFNWFFPRKALWSTIETTRQNITSLKKFYKFLLEQERIDQDDYEFLLQIIREEKDEWLSHYDYLENSDFDRW